jgi:hypothetical protein
MPIHPMACDHCGHHYDSLTLSAAAVPDATCPRCRQLGRRDGFGVPAVKTQQFLPGTALEGGQFADPAMRRKYAGTADVSGKRYMASIARFPGDPRAWVSDMAEAKRVIEANGWACPTLGVRGKDPAPVAPPTLAPDLVHEEIEGMALRGEIPETITKKKYRDLAEGVKDRHGLKPAAAKRFAAKTPRPKQRKAVAK